MKSIIQQFTVTTLILVSIIVLPSQVSAQIGRTTKEAVKELGGASNKSKVIRNGKKAGSSAKNNSKSGSSSTDSKKRSSNSQSTSSKKGGTNSKKTKNSTKAGNTTSSRKRATPPNQSINQSAVQNKISKPNSVQKEQPKNTAPTSNQSVKTNVSSNSSKPKASFDKRKPDNNSTVLYKNREGKSELKVRKNTSTGEVKYDRVSRTGKTHDHEFVKVNPSAGKVIEGGAKRQPQKK